MPLRWRMGIQVKMTLIFSGVFILLSLAFNLFAYQRIRKILIADSDRYLLARANALLEKTETWPAIIPLPDKNAFIRVSYSAEGQRQVLFQSPGVLDHVVTPAAEGVSDTLGLRIAYVKSTSEDTPAELLLAVSNEPLAQNLRLLVTLLLTSSLISSLLSALVSHSVAGSLLRPLQRIIRAAQQVNTTRMPAPLPVNGTLDELDRLSMTINDMMQRIAESVQQQQNFFASASHELKTPLAILRTALEVGLRKKGLDAGTRELFASQLEEIGRLQDIVQEFLIVGQLKADAPSLYLQPVDLSATLVKVFHQLLPLLRQKQQEPVIRFDEQADDFIVTADEDKLRTVWLNLVENAAKYGAAGTPVTCRVEKPGTARQVTLWFSNYLYEESIPTENLQLAFYRSDLVQKGAGLGLWLCNEIIRLHGGTLEMNSGGYQFQVKIVLPL